MPRPLIARATLVWRLRPLHRHLHHSTRHVRQHAWHAVLRYFIRRIARSGDRLRRRRLPAGDGACRRRHPATTRSTQARHVAARHAAARVRHGRDPVGRVRRQNHRHADCAAHPQRGRAQQGLLEHRRHVSTRARRLHLLAEVRHPRLSRRRSTVRARDGGARRRGRNCAQVVARALRRNRSRLPRPDRLASDSVQVMGICRRESVFRGQRRGRARARSVHGCAAQVRRFGRCAHQRHRAERASRLGRAGLRQARRRHRRRR